MKNLKILYFTPLFLLFFACKKEKILVDKELIGTWRFDSAMYVSSNAAFYIDTLYFGHAPNKRLVMRISDNNAIEFEHISKEIVGKGSFTVTEFKGIKASVYPTNYSISAIFIGLFIILWKQ